MSTVEEHRLARVEHRVETVVIGGLLLHAARGGLQLKHWTGDGQRRHRETRRLRALEALAQVRDVTDSLPEHLDFRQLLRVLVETGNLLPQQFQGVVQDVSAIPLAGARLKSPRLVQQGPLAVARLLRGVRIVVGLRRTRRVRGLATWEAVVVVLVIAYCHRLHFFFFISVPPLIFPTRFLFVRRSLGACAWNSSPALSFVCGGVFFFLSSLAAGKPVQRSVREHEHAGQHLDAVSEQMSGCSLFPSRYKRMPRHTRVAWWPMKWLR